MDDAAKEFQNLKSVSFNSDEKNNNIIKLLYKYRNEILIVMAYTLIKEFNYDITNPKNKWEDIVEMCVECLGISVWVRSPKSLNKKPGISSNYPQKVRLFTDGINIYHIHKINAISANPDIMSPKIPEIDKLKKEVIEKDKLIQNYIVTEKKLNNINETADNLSKKLAQYESLLADLVKIIDIECIFAKYFSFS